MFTNYRPNQKPELDTSLKGLTMEEAEKICPNIRPAIIDGKHMMLTMDMRPDRMNVELKDGIIINLLGYY